MSPCLLPHRTPGPPGRTTTGCFHPALADSRSCRVRTTPLRMGIGITAWGPACTRVVAGRPEDLADHRAGPTAPAIRAEAATPEAAPPTVVRPVRAAVAA